MKKFAKVMGLISLGLLVLSLVFMLIGKIGGGTATLGTMVTNDALSFGPDDFTLSGLQVINGVQYEISDNTMFNDKYNVFTAGHYEMDTDGKKVTSLVVSISGGEIEVLRGEENYWKVTIDGAGRFQTYMENGTLYIIGTQSELSTELGDVTIYTPNGGYSLSNAEISLGAGEMTIDYMATENLKMSVGAGEIIVQNGAIGDADVSVGMGSVEINAEIAGSIDGSVAMGELVFVVEGTREDDHNYVLSCGAGELVVGKKSYSGLNVSTEINNHASSTYDLSCAMGSIEVRFR